MKRIWNYFFYSTWLLQFSLGKILIEKPLAYFFSKIPFLHNNWTKGKKGYDKFMHDKNGGLNIGFSFGFMFLSTMIIYSIICLIVIKLFQNQVDERIYYFFYLIAILSYLTNYICIYRLDIYKKYFEEFKNIEPKSKIYISAILFHTGILFFGILSVYLTIGFNF